MLLPAAQHEIAQRDLRNKTIRRISHENKRLFIYCRRLNSRWVIKGGNLVCFHNASRCIINSNNKREEVDGLLCVSGRLYIQWLMQGIFWFHFLRYNGFRFSLVEGLITTENVRFMLKLRFSNQICAMGVCSKFFYKSAKDCFRKTFCYFVGQSKKFLQN